MSTPKNEKTARRISAGIPALEATQLAEHEDTNKHLEDIKNAVKDNIIVDIKEGSGLG